jgi:hypothetical protein
MEGWHLNDNTRSSWDILWTCLATILACTWTALHLSVPRRDSQGDQLANKMAAWIVAILAPELTTASAVEDFCRAKSIAARCNAAFEAVDNERVNSSESAKPNESTKIEHNIGPGDDTGPKDKAGLEEKAQPQTQPQKKLKSDPSSSRSTKKRWESIQGFCLNMNGVLLQTKDEWTYPVHPGNVVPFIKAGIIKSSHLKVREINDRAKADSFAKAFTLLQSLWVTCNIIARRAYDLPITPLEISTVAYVASAVVTYSMLWHKPKDMVTPITIHLQHDRNCDDLHCRLKDILNENDGNWILKDDFAEDSTSPVWEAIVRLFEVFTALVTTQGRRTIKRRWQLAVNKKHSPGSHRQDAINHRNDEENTEQAQPSKETQQKTNNTNDDDEYFTIADSFKLACFDIFITLLFTGIHVAAYVMPPSHYLLFSEINRGNRWNFTFPTQAEKTAWQVFSLVAFLVPLPIGMLGLWMCYQLLRRSGGNKMARASTAAMNVWKLIVFSVLFCVYSTARWGTIILMFISLRALPAGSYTTIEWLSTIPHI